MAVWARVQSIPGVRDLYGPHFPMEIRHFFAAWLEGQALCVPSVAPRLPHPRARR